MHSELPRSCRARRLSAVSVFAASAALLLCLAPGCGGSPSEAYQEAMMAVEMEDKEAFMSHLTERSADLLRSLEEVEEESGGRLKYVRDPLKIHEFGAVVSEEIYDDVAVLTVTVNRREQRVLMVSEHGSWRIELMELPEFWEPLRY